MSLSTDAVRPSQELPVAPAAKQIWIWNNREIDLMDPKNEKYRDARFERIMSIVTAAFFALIGTICMLTGHPYLGVASYVGAGICFFKRNEDINRIEKADLLKEKAIQEMGGQAKVDALPEVQWAHWNGIPAVLRKREYFPIIRPSDMTQPKMRIVENGELIGIAEKISVPLTKEYLILNLTAFKSLPKLAPLLPKKEDLAGWGLVRIRDGSIEGKEDNYKIRIE